MHTEINSTHDFHVHFRTYLQTTEKGHDNAQMSRKTASQLIYLRPLRRDGK